MAKVRPWIAFGRCFVLMNVLQSHFPGQTTCDEDAWRNHALSLESELESLIQKQDLEDEEGMFESSNLIPSVSLTRPSTAKRALWLSARHVASAYSSLHHVASCTLSLIIRLRMERVLRISKRIMVTMLSTSLRMHLKSLSFSGVREEICCINRIDNFRVQLYMCE
jgi:hypothetical protein